MKDLLLRNWHPMRFARLAFSIFLFVQAYILNQWFFIAFGLFFLIQVIFNSGCGANGCAVPNKKYKRR